MITKPTVFVVGAGASHAYRFPLGAELVNDILERLTLVPSGSDLVAALGFMGIHSSHWERFRDRLRGSASESIDTFLEGSDQVTTTIGKAAIAIRILEAEKECLENGWLAKPPERGDNYLFYLWNRMRSQCQSAEELLRNKVTFLTFNYDRTIEYFFETATANAFDISPAEAADLRARAVPVVHLHGQVGGEFGRYRKGTIKGELSELAAGIKVIHEETPDADDGFARAHNAFGVAMRICFLGFGYHPVNMARLNVAEHAGSSCVISGTTYRMGLAQIADAEFALGRKLEKSGVLARCEEHIKHAVALS